MIAIVILPLQSIEQFNFLAALPDVLSAFKQASFPVYRSMLSTLPVPELFELCYNN